MIKRVLAAVAMLTLLHTSAWADYCDGAINIVAVDNWGQLFVRHGGKGYWLLCNVQDDGTYGATMVKSSACRSWQAILTAAQKTGSTVRLYRNGSGTCASVGSWVTADVYFVEDLG